MDCVIVDFILEFLVAHMNRKHDSEVDLPLHCVGNDWVMFWYWLWWIVCMNIDETLQVSPKRELQNLVSGFWFALLA